MTTIAGERNKTQDLVYVSIFAVLIAVCSWISIPAAVPFTLQTMGVFTAVGILGGRRGSMAVLIYILLGIIGIPVFAGFTGGIGVLAGTTGGYIVGFLVSALAMPADSLPSAWLQNTLLHQMKKLFPGNDTIFFQSTCKQHLSVIFFHFILANADIFP